MTEHQETMLAALNNFVERVRSGEIVAISIAGVVAAERRQGNERSMGGFCGNVDQAESPKKDSRRYGEYLALQETENLRGLALYFNGKMDRKTVRRICGFATRLDKSAFGFGDAE